MLYVIQVDSRYWLAGVWQGWLKTTESLTEAGTFHSFEEAHEVMQCCNDLSPKSRYTIRTIG